MFNWLVYFHIAGALCFMMAHGISAGVAFALVRERHLERVRALLELSASSYGVMYISLLVLLIAGIAATFAGGYWDRGWIWASIILLIVIMGVMGRFGSSIYGQVRRAVGLPYFEKMKIQPPLPPASDEEIARLLAAGQPMLLTIVGLGGILIIVWLMRFKPF